MVIQFIIDWNHLVDLIFDGSGDDAALREYSRLRLVEVELRRIRENISINGILPRGKHPSWLRDLNDLIRRLRTKFDAVMDMDVKRVVENLRLLLEGIRDKVYIDRGCVFETGASSGIGERVDQVKRFLLKEGFDRLERRIKTAVITARQCDNSDNLWQYTTLDDYAGSKFEQLRQKWERNISFGPGQENEFLEYLSGVALASIAFNSHEIELYDPHWSSNVLRPHRDANPRWNDVTKFYTWFFCSFPTIAKLIFVSEESDGECDRATADRRGCTVDELHFELFKTAIPNLVKTNRRNGVKFEIGIRIRRKSGDFHNRYIFTGSIDSLGCLGCLMPDGIDLVRRGGNGCVRISRTFECCLWSMNHSAEWRHICDDETYFDRSCISLANGDFIPVSQVRREVANFPYRGETGA